MAISLVFALVDLLMKYSIIFCIVPTHRIWSYSSGVVLGILAYFTAFLPHICEIHCTNFRPKEVDYHLMMTKSLTFKNISASPKCTWNTSWWWITQDVEEPLLDSQLPKCANFAFWHSRQVRNAPHQRWFCSKNPHLPIVAVRFILYIFGTVRMVYWLQILYQMNLVSLQM